MLRKITTLLLIVILLSLSLIPTRQGQAQAGSAYDMIAAVNAFRAANGLGPLEVDPVLMSIAQAHSDYQASIQTITHTGSGGTSARDRAAAAGFGNGASFFVSENIAGGIGLSPTDAIYTYWQDQLHLNTMLGDYAFIGAGVGFSGDYVYYTIDVGYYTGAPTPAPVDGQESVSTQNPAATVGPTSTPRPTDIPIGAFIIATPQADGSIIHTIGYGQTLYGIAETYGVTLNDLYELNSFISPDDTAIYEGQQLVIVAAGEPQAGATETTLDETDPITSTQVIDTSPAITDTSGITDTSATTETVDIVPTEPAATRTPLPTPTPTMAPTGTEAAEEVPTEVAAIPPDESNTDDTPGNLLGNRTILTYTALGLAFVVLLVVLISGFTNPPTNRILEEDHFDEET